MARSLNNISRLHYAQRDWEGAADFARRATRVIVDRAKRVSVADSNSSRARGELGEGASTFAWLMLADWPLAQQRPARFAELLDETFAAAQWTGQTVAGAALAQMAARLARGESKLAAQVREQQNLSLQWQQLDKAAINVRTAPSEDRHAADEAALAQRLADTERQLAALNARLIVDFPEYAALSSPEPLSVQATQKLLGLDEALVQFAFAEGESYLWAISKTDARWVKLALSPKTIAAQVELLRCGLDRDGEWEWSQQRQRWFALRSSCAKLRPEGLSRKELPPFDGSLAFELYQGLLGSVEALITNKHLLIVSSGVLATIPFAALVTAPPDTALKEATAFRKAAWLGRRHPITMLPSVSSLRSLRELSRPSQATQPLIGFGNPLLDGDPANPDHALRAQEARTKVNCASGPSTRDQTVALGRTADARAVYRNGQVDISEIRKQLPLPETADELCAVARSVGATDDDIYLGARATKAAVLKLSREGILARYRVVHFATHGLLAGETEWFAAGHAEPALLLTPGFSNGDASPPEENNGLLTTSDVSQLKLDADWVVLSACNTASANSTGGEEALSGLARAFFYAGARSLLVSHWYVDSEATVKLISNAFDRLKVDVKLGRAEALRQAMGALIDTNEAHPSYWAPFVLVGEGSTPLR